MNRWKSVVSTQTVNLLSGQGSQPQQKCMTRNLSHTRGGKNQGGGKNGSKWWRTAGTVTAASAAVMAYKINQERER